MVTTHQNNQWLKDGSVNGYTVPNTKSNDIKITDDLMSSSIG